MKWYGRKEFQKRSSKVIPGKGTRCSRVSLILFYHFHKVQFEFTFELTYEGNVKGIFLGIGFLFFAFHFMADRMYPWIKPLND